MLCSSLQFFFTTVSVICPLLDTLHPLGIIILVKLITSRYRTPSSTTRPASCSYSSIGAYPTKPAGPHCSTPKISPAVGVTSTTRKATGPSRSRHPIAASTASSSRAAKPHPRFRDRSSPNSNSKYPSPTTPPARRNRTKRTKRGRIGAATTTTTVIMTWPMISMTTITLMMKTPTTTKAKPSRSSAPSCYSPPSPRSSTTGCGSRARPRLANRVGRPQATPPPSRLRMSRLTRSCCSCWLRSVGRARSAG